MSSGLMDTEIGGEQTQYEGINTFQKPHAKSGGQFGQPETELDSSSSADAQANADKGAASAEKIRYGQSISEQGFGGQTTTSSGSANSEAAGGESVDDEAKSARKAAGYGGDNDMNLEVGA